MPTLRRTILTLGMTAPLLTLAACDGYEMRLYDGFPYGGDRTAGHGVHYVLAKMMPKKGPVLEPATPPAPVVEPEMPAEPAPPVAAPEPQTDLIQPADPIIEKKARK